MAIIFTKQLTETIPVNAYNNNNVVFSSDSVLTAIRAIIKVKGISVSITPDANGIFTYNFKELFQTVINENYFRDELTESTDINLAVNNFVFLDDKVFEEILVEYEIVFSNETNETLDKTYKVMRSVVQLEDYKRGLTNETNANIALLLPFYGFSNKHYKGYYFEGYPFDFALYSDVARTINVRNVKLDLDVDIDVSKGVNRIFISDGSNNWTFENILPFYVGRNELEITYAGQPASEMLTLYLTKSVNECGTLLKWFNNFGGWNYYLFNEASQTRRIKQIGDISKTFDDLNEMNGTRHNIGVESIDSIKLFYSGVEEKEKGLINSLFESPKVYRYVNDIFQHAGKSDFIIESIQASSLELKNKKNFTYEASFEISKSDRFNMSL